jgi:hypothetical protein
LKVKNTINKFLEIEPAQITIQEIYFYYFVNMIAKIYILKVLQKKHYRRVGKIQNLIVLDVIFLNFFLSKSIFLLFLYTKSHK